MGNINEKLLTIIKQDSSINEEEKKLWQEAIDGLPEKFCNDIYEFIIFEPSGIKILTDSLKEKLGALRNKDMAELEKIFDKDKKFIESLRE